MLKKVYHAQTVICWDCSGMCVKTQFIRIAKAGLPYKPQFNGIAMGSLQDSKPWQKRARERIHCFYSSYSDTLSGDKISKDGHAL